MVACLHPITQQPITVILQKRTAQVPGAMQTKEGDVLRRETWRVRLVDRRAHIKTLSKTFYRKVGREYQIKMAQD